MLLRPENVLKLVEEQDAKIRQGVYELGARREGELESRVSSEEVRYSYLEIHISCSTILSDRLVQIRSIQADTLPHGLFHRSRIRLRSCSTVSRTIFSLRNSSFTTQTTSSKSEPPPPVPRPLPPHQTLTNRAQTSLTPIASTSITTWKNPSLQLVNPRARLGT